MGRVDISINEFQKISNGKFNAGEVRLASETELEKVNNHVSKTWCNKVSMSYAEVIAIKQAFVSALTRSGVSIEDANRVREQLGLMSAGEEDANLKSRSIKPFCDPVRVQRVAKKLDGAALLAALNAKDATNETRFAAIQKFADDLGAAIMNEFREESRRGVLGADEMMLVTAFAHIFVLGSTPGLGETCRRLAADPFVPAARAHFKSDEQASANPLRAQAVASFFGA